MFRLKLHVSVNISVNSQRNYHKPLQTMTRTTTNDDMNHHKSQITTNHHKPWHKPPWTMTEISTKHEMNHYKSPQTMTWTIMMTQKELCIKPYGFLVVFFIGLVFFQGIIVWGEGVYWRWKQKMAVPRTIVPSSFLDSCLAKTNASCTHLSTLNGLCVHAKGVYWIVNCVH